MKFEDGDMIRHKQHKDRQGVVGEIAVIDGKEVGNWFNENNGARWILQRSWQTHWEKVKVK